MILRLAVENWRAYEALDLELGPGTTFVVASNGVGKTSLILAAAWGIFGEASGVDAAEEIRGDAQTAAVEVLLRLPVSGNALIRRTVNRKGQSKLEARVGSRTIEDQADLRSLVMTELGGDLQVLARLTFLAHGGALESSQGEFQLREHLASVFGVTPLLEAARSADRMASEAAAAARKLKAGQRTDRSEAAKLAAAVEWVDDQLAAATSSRSEIAEQLNAADERRRLADDWERYRAALATRRESLEALAARVQALVDRDLAGGELAAALGTMEQELQDELSAAAASVAAANAELRMIEEAQQHLRDAGAACPTCLRPLSGSDSSVAMRRHSERRSEVELQARKAAALLESRRASLEAVAGILAEVRILPVPMLPPGEELAAEEVTEAREGYEQVRERLQEVDRLLGELTAGKRMSEARIAELEEVERQTSAIVGLLRREAVARAAGDTFRAAGDGITTQQIEPLVAEVGRRWKLIFGAEGLRLSPQGEITRSVGTRVLPFRSLSGGEKVWALLLTRLLITGASTNAPFIWLDEPLEHLDPRLRRVVAGTLARASSTGALRQVVVTTYESELARQLMEDVPSASLIYVRSSA